MRRGGVRVHAGERADREGGVRVPRVRAPAGVHGGGKFILTLVWAILLTSCFVTGGERGERQVAEGGDRADLPRGRRGR